jgi:hypothetical protein
MPSFAIFLYSSKFLTRGSGNLFEKKEKSLFHEVEDARKRLAGLK